MRRYGAKLARGIALTIGALGRDVFRRDYSSLRWNYLRAILTFPCIFGRRARNSEVSAGIQERRRQYVGTGTSGSGGMGAA